MLGGQLVHVRLAGPPAPTDRLGVGVRESRRLFQSSACVDRGCASPLTVPAPRAETAGVFTAPASLNRAQPTGGEVPCLPFGRVVLRAQAQRVHRPLTALDQADDTSPVTL